MICFFLKACTAVSWVATAAKTNNKKQMSPKQFKLSFTPFVCLSNWFKYKLSNDSDNKLSLNKIYNPKTVEKTRFSQNPELYLA